MSSDCSKVRTLHTGTEKMINKWMNAAIDAAGSLTALAAPRPCSLMAATLNSYTTLLLRPVTTCVHSKECVMMSKASSKETERQCSTALADVPHVLAAAAASGCFSNSVRQH